MSYVSQHGQDRFLDVEIFKGKEKGVFIDVGASDGVTMSNSHFFEKARHWTGICVEPREKQFQKLVKNRECICACCCIADVSGVQEFLEIEGYSAALSGLVKKYHPEHEKRIAREAEKYATEQTVVTKECLLLSDLLKKHDIGHVDLCSIDIEGGELDVLKAIDFAQYDIDVFVVENPYDNTQMNSFFVAQGYRRVKRIECDEIYVREGLL